MKKMNDDLNKSYTRAFGQHPIEYEKWAAPQRDCAEKLVSLAAHDLKQKVHLDVLDVGGGTGFIYNAAARNGLLSNAKFVNVDASEPALNFCRKSKNVPCVLADAHNIPFVNNAFNLIFSSFCFHWLEDAAHHVMQLIRCLKAGGSFYQAVPIAGSLDEFYTCIQNEGSGFEMNPMKYPTESDVTDALKNGGFKIDRCIQDIFSFEASSIIDALRFMRYAGGAAVTRDQNKGSLFHLAARLAHFKSVPPINFRVLITTARKP